MSLADAVDMAGKRDMPFGGFDAREPSAQYVRMEGGRRVATVPTDEEEAELVAELAGRARVGKRRNPFGDGLSEEFSRPVKQSRREVVAEGGALPATQEAAVSRVVAQILRQQQAMLDRLGRLESSLKSTNALIREYGGDERGALAGAFDSFSLGGPRRVPSDVERALEYWKGGSPDEALTLLDALLTANPDDFFLRALRGDICLQKVDLEEAYRELSLVLRQKPNDVFSLARCSKVCRLARHLEKAREYLDLALQIDPRDAFALAERAELEKVERTPPYIV